MVKYKVVKYTEDFYQGYIIKTNTESSIYKRMEKAFEDYCNGKGLFHLK